MLVQNARARVHGWPLRGDRRWPVMSDLGTLAEDDKARLGRIIRWHAVAAGANPDDGYLAIGIRNTLAAVERILAARAGEMQLTAKGWADEATRLRAQLYALTDDLPGMWERADFMGGEEETNQ